MIDTILPLPAYRTQRVALRREAIARRRVRTVSLGPAMRVQFEDAHSARHQVHEVLHAARCSEAAAVRQTIADFAHLLPDRRHWVATLLIELPDRARRAAELPRLSAAVHALRLQVDGAAPVPADVNWDLPDRHLGRPSAVHFLRFAPGAGLLHRLRAGHAAALACAHPAYAWSSRLPAVLAQRLGAEVDDFPDPVR